MLEDLYKRHSYWVKLVQKFGEKDFAEDIVQEMYIKLDRLIKAEIFKDTPPQSYIYLTLRSITLDVKRKNKKVNFVEIEDVYKVEESNKASQDAYNKLHDRIADISEGWHWFDQTLFKLYKSSGKSIRELSKETNISVGTIFHSLKKCKQDIRQELGEDYEDYINEDYERI